MKIITAFFTAATLATGAIYGDVVTEKVQYKDGTVSLEGTLAYDAAGKGKKPAVIIFHQWQGVSEHEIDVAQRLAKAGYVAFAADVFGAGVRPQGMEAASAEAKKYYTDRALFRRRANAALAQLKANPKVDPSKIAAIGYCFGGSAALELGRSGAQLAGIVSLHGGLNNPAPGDAKNIKKPVLVLHGADDPFVKKPEVDQFMKEMKDAGAKVEFVSYPGAVHSFTIKASGNDNSKGAAYNAAADSKSWEAMAAFLKKILG